MNEAAYAEEINYISCLYVSEGSSNSFYSSFRLKTLLPSEDIHLTKLLHFGLHAIRLLLLFVKSSVSLAEMVVNQGDRARSDQRF